MIDTILNNNDNLSLNEDTAFGNPRALHDIDSIFDNNLDSVN